MTDPRHAHRSAMLDTDTAHHRAIKSFVLRTGRVTTGQEKALTALGPQFIVPFQAAPDSQKSPNTPATIESNAINNINEEASNTAPFDWNARFGRAAPRVLEIGFGMGEATAHIARLKPELDFIGCEVHTPGVGALLKRIGDSQTTHQPLSNIRIVQHDAVQVLNHMIADGSLTGVHIFFPDPWHKARHHKRRLIQAPLVQLLAQKLQTGGYLHAATDWESYAEQILQVLQNEPQLANTSDHENGYADKPDYRPLTKFENRGIRLGHGVWDVVFEKR